MGGVVVDGVGERAQQGLVRRPGEVGARRRAGEAVPDAYGVGTVGGALSPVVGQQGESAGARRSLEGQRGQLVVVDPEEATLGR